MTATQTDLAALGFTGALVTLAFALALAVAWLLERRRRR
jgi:hypothetical protein